MTEEVKEQKKIERRKAPAVEVVDVFGDDRKAQLDRLDKENPDFVHSYQDARVTPGDLAKRGQEAVKNELGAQLEHNGDIVVRQPRELFDKRRGIEQERSLRTTKEMTKGREEALERVANPVKPKPIKKE